MDEMFEVKLGGVNERPSEFATADAAGFDMTNTALKVKGLNWKLTKVEEDIKKSQNANRQTAEKVASKAKNYSGRKITDPSDVATPTDVPFEQSMGATALGNESMVKVNPLFSDSAC